MQISTLEDRHEPGMLKKRKTGRQQLLDTCYRVLLGLHRQADRPLPLINIEKLLAKNEDWAWCGAGCELNFQISNETERLRQAYKFYAQANLTTEAFRVASKMVACVKDKAQFLEIASDLLDSYRADKQVIVRLSEKAKSLQLFRKHAFFNLLAGIEPSEHKDSVSSCKYFLDGKVFDFVESRRKAWPFEKKSRLTRSLGIPSIFKRNFESGACPIKVIQVIPLPLRHHTTARSHHAGNVFYYNPNQGDAGQPIEETKQNRHLVWMSQSALPL